ncbi:MAG: energy transducer TonB [Acidobacteria bacterium]|nr:energy transducer TonB [Acidobacteriota bacterium]
MEPRLVKSVPGLDGAALDTVRTWRFEPAVKGGRPVPGNMGGDERRGLGGVPPRPPTRLAR